MTVKERIKKIKSNFFDRTILVAILSQFVNLAFIVYNLYLGIEYHDAFAIGISIYYSLLFLAMLASLLVEVAISKRTEEIKRAIRVKNYKVLSVIIFIIDFCLIAPIILMVTQPKEVMFGIIPAIAMAAYCVYKITSAIVNYRRSKRSQNPTIILFKEINIIAAIVSILTLQHTLIMVNGGMTRDMQALSLSTSIGFIVLIVTFSILSFIKNKKLFSTVGRGGE